MRRLIQAPMASTWSLISDVGGYSRYAPNIDHSKILSGEGVGMVRECSNKDGDWREVCTEWIEGQHYDFEIQTHEKNYPYLLKVLKGHWSVEEQVGNATLVKMVFQYEFKNKILGYLLDPIMRRQFTKVCKALLDNWEKVLSTD